MTVKTSGWALSTSSKRTTADGHLIRASVNWPPSWYPVWKRKSKTKHVDYLRKQSSSKLSYPGGAPINFETSCFSWYSLISIRIKQRDWFFSPFRYLAICLANSVLPTPDEPRKRKTSGESSLVQPDSFRRIAKYESLIFFYKGWCSLSYLS